MFKRPENKTKLCPRIYIGPTDVIYDEKSDCVTALPTSQQSFLNLVLSSDQTDCQNPNPANMRAKYWKSLVCEEKHHLIPEDLVQIKQNCML